MLNATCARGLVPRVALLRVAWLSIARLRVGLLPVVALRRIRVGRLGVPLRRVPRLLPVVASVCGVVWRGPVPVLRRRRRAIGGERSGRRRSVRRRRGGGRRGGTSVGGSLLSLALGGTLPQRGLESAQLGDTRAQVGRDDEPPCLQLLLAGVRVRTGV